MGNTKKTLKDLSQEELLALATELTSSNENLGKELVAATKEVDSLKKDLVKSQKVVEELTTENTGLKKTVSEASTSEAKIVELQNKLTAAQDVEKELLEQNSALVKAQELGEKTGKHVQIFTFKKKNYKLLIPSSYYNLGGTMRKVNADTLKDDKELLEAAINAGKLKEVE